MRIPPDEHGDNSRQVAVAAGADPARLVDLAASMNPFAPDVRSVVAAGVDGITRYPDERDRRRARHALAEAMGVDRDRLIVTNGGAEAIALVAAELGAGWVEEPEFSLYRRHLALVEPGAPRFRSDPHNPTGRLAGPGATAGVWDEAFYPLATGRWTRGAAAQGGAVVVGSLTKVFACPGLRLGYALAPESAPGLPARLERRQPRWSVGTIALLALPQLVARADLPGWHAAIAAARGELVAVLARHGLRAERSDANFVLVRGVPGLRDRLAACGVVVRDCTSFGMPDAVRIAVPGAEGLERLDGALGRARWPDGPGAEGSLRADGRRTTGPRPGVAPVGRHGGAVPGRRARAGGGSGSAGAVVLPGRGAALMVCGTASDVGKSQLVTGLCRLLARQGVRVAPFKGQNMALNSFVTADGLEIGRAQAAQAMAAGIEPEVEMNPLLLKPTGDRTSQVVVMGRPWRVLDAAGYQKAKPELVDVVMAALADLRSRYDVVLLEGAGSPAEINLGRGDLVNLGLAAQAGIPAIVVGDIDRGGVFAALYGTVALLDHDLRPWVRGFVVNKLRGDPTLLGNVLSDLETRCGVPTLGVLPFVAGLDLDAEDSVALERRRTGGGDLAVPTAGPAGSAAWTIDVAVIRFPHIANFTDVDPLVLEPAVRVRFVDSPDELGDPDLVVLPGTKTTVADLAWLRETGLARAVAAVAGREGAAGEPGDGRGAPGTAVVVGICGGYQMLGGAIEDPVGVESACPVVDGLGWLDVRTVFEPTKQTRRRAGTVHGRPATGGPDIAAGPVRVQGYEIHHGRPQVGSHARAWFDLVEVAAGRTAGPARPGVAPDAVAPDGVAPDAVAPDAVAPDGVAPDAVVPEGVADEDAGVYGTSLHGVFESDELRRELLAAVARRRGRRWVASGLAFPAARDEQFDRLARLCADHLDMDRLWSIAADARAAGGPR